MSRYPFRQRFGREAVKKILSLLCRWNSLPEPVEGFSIVIGVPWDLRHLLSTNLLFVSRTDLSRLDQIYIVFDRTHRPEMDQVENEMRKEFSELPLEFLHYPRVAGSLVERVHVSTFYNSMNTTLAIGRCRTQYAVMHDFDLYPLKEDHFTSICDTMRDRQWRFSGHELTNFDGLNDGDLQVGTWTLGIDIQWLRENFQPIDCFHRVSRHRGRYFNLDPFAWLQFQTPARGLVGRGVPDERFCHVRNLCSTYLRFLKQAELKVAWRLHYLWYLEEVSGRMGRLREVTAAMREAASPVLEVDRLPADFSDTHVTCANVLGNELQAMDRALFGETRRPVLDFIEAFREFLEQFGNSDEITDGAGNVVWSRPSSNETEVQVQR